MKAVILSPLLSLFITTSSLASSLLTTLPSQPPLTSVNNSNETSNSYAPILGSEDSQFSRESKKEKEQIEQEKFAAKLERDRVEQKAEELRRRRSGELGDSILHNPTPFRQY